MVGIYAIKNIVNNKIYIGSSNNIKRRFIKHKTELRKKKHCNKYLERAFHKYGENEFDFIILELCELENIIEREIYYIQLYKSLEREYGYNLTIPIKHPSLETREEYCKAISERMKGITPSNFKEMQKSRWLKVKAYKDGEFYGEYESCVDAEKQLGLNRGYLNSYFKNPNRNRRVLPNFTFEKQ